MANIKYTKELIQEAVSRSFTWTETCKQLGIKAATGSQTNLVNRAKIFGIDFSHFLTASQCSKRPRPNCKRDIIDYLKDNGPFINSHKLKVKLISVGLKEYKCEGCGGTEWMGERIPLELHHVDGDRKNNNLENLKVLCCNCHSVIPNYAGKKRQCGETADTARLERAVEIHAGSIPATGTNL